MLEREEGLLSRHGATRLLCVLAILGWVAAFAAGCGAVWAAVSQNTPPLDFFISRFPLILAALALAWVSAAALWLWRRCDRCGRRLFAGGASNGLAMHVLRKPENKVLWARTWWGQRALASERDYRARPLLGSYRNAAIVSMALRGRLRCQWCGHDDGAPPDYVAKP